MNNNTQQMANSEYSIPPFPKDTVVAMAYIPFQNPTAMYSAEEGLEAGTLFPCLDKPFLGCGGGSQ